MHTSLLPSPLPRIGPGPTLTRRWWPKITAPAYTLLLVLSITACESSSRRSNNSQKEMDEVVPNSSSPSSADSRRRSSPRGRYTPSKVLVQSLSNRPLTSQNVRVSEAAELAASLQAKHNPSEKDLVTALAAARVGGASTTEMLQHAGDLMKLRIAQSQKDLPNFAKLEIGLAAIQDKNLARARIFLDPLIKTANNPIILASIYNGYGIAALQIGQKTDAAGFFKKSLSYLGSFEPALLNMGFLALEYGHYKKAERYLSSIQKDWYAQTGLVTALRQRGQNNQVKTLCATLTQQRAKNKMVLFNCGLFYFENLGSKERAQSLIEKATQESGGLMHWDEKAFEIMEKLQ